MNVFSSKGFKKLAQQNKKLFAQRFRMTSLDKYDKFVDSLADAEWQLVESQVYQSGVEQNEEPYWDNRNETTEYKNTSEGYDDIEINISMAAYGIYLPLELENKIEISKIIPAFAQQCPECILESSAYMQAVENAKMEQGGPGVSLTNAERKSFDVSLKSVNRTGEEAATIIIDVNEVLEASYEMYNPAEDQY